MTADERRWFDTDLMRRVQSKLEEAFAQLCDTAQERSFTFPCEVDLSDSYGTLAFQADFSLEETNEWVWMSHAKRGEIDDLQPLTLTFTNGAGEKLSTEFRVNTNLKVVA